MTKGELTELVLDMYENNKFAKEYLEHFLNPMEVGKDALERYKCIIVKEFDVEHPMTAGNSFAKAKKAISDFTALKPDKELMADLLLTLPEAACEFTNAFGDMDVHYYESAYRNFQRALTFMSKNDLLEKFKDRCTKCVEYASTCGYGFEDGMMELFVDFYGEPAKFTNKYGETYE
jgi:hypothetical protein